ncbi:MAG: T9SS type A sorting domain-containing protein [Bacteroidia bacterium]
MKKAIYLSVALALVMQAVNAQWTVDTLSTPSYNLISTQNGSKAIYTNGNKFEMYDFATSTWSLQNISFARGNMKAATANGKSYFGGGGFIGIFSYAFYNNVDIYNSTTNAWSINTLSQARIVGASAGLGNKVFFAGGRLILNYSNKVDIFNVNTGVRTTAILSQARTGMAVGVAGNKVVFAGGETGNISSGIYLSSNKVDIYNNATGTWSTALLSSKRGQIAVGVVGTKILFAGGLNSNGYYSKVVDIYDAATNTWSTANMSEPKYGIAVATAGNKVYFAGGTTSNSGALSNRVEIYNATTNTWSYVTITSPRMSMSVAKTPKRIMFAGGVVTWGNTGTDRIEVLDLTTNTWSVEYLSRPRLGIASASYGNKAMFAGGAEVISSYPQYSIISNKVDIWTDPFPRIANYEFAAASQVTVFPNPFTDNISIQFQSVDQPITVSIYNAIGKLHRTIPLTDLQTELNLSDLKSGIYFLNVMQDSQTIQTVRIIKE